MQNWRRHSLSLAGNIGLLVRLRPGIDNVRPVLGRLVPSDRILHVTQHYADPRVINRDYSNMAPT